MKKRKTEDSVYEIRTGDATTAIRGTDLRIGRSPDRTSRVMTLKGKVLTNTPDGDVAIPAGQGLVYKAGVKPTTVPLPPPPRVTAPPFAPFRTASQRMRFKWAAPAHAPQARRWGRGRDLKSSCVIEIATDKGFNHPVWRAVAEGTEAAAGW